MPPEACAQGRSELYYHYHLIIQAARSGPGRSMTPLKIFAINLGSTSTKIAYYEDETCRLKQTFQFQS